ncbi:hypothetical protein [Myxosarcina sp. GI1]|uniref:hypothetical protein n=1 Tax=Myxosarcina sp. GI1 TaxID=1541065 RepID=UPI00055A8C50|nr:hypothetical protein [Myxosarcina sp. GI1]
MTSITINFSGITGSGKSLFISSLLFSAYGCHIESEYDRGYKRGKQDFKRGIKRNLYNFYNPWFWYIFDDFEYGYQKGWKAAQEEQIGYLLGYLQDWEAAQRLKKYFSFSWSWLSLRNLLDSWYARPTEYVLGYEQGKQDYRKNQFPLLAYLYRFESREYRRGHLQGWEAAQKLEQYISCTNTFKSLMNSWETKEYQIGYEQGKFYSKKSIYRIIIFVSSIGTFSATLIASLIPRSSSPTWRKLSQKLSNENIFMDVKLNYNYEEFDCDNLKQNKIYKNKLSKEKSKDQLFLSKSKDINNYSRGSPILFELFKRDNLASYGVRIVDRIFNELTISTQQFNKVVDEVFLKSNSEGAKLWRFTKGKLKKFSLDRAYQPEKIFTIAYERTRKAIEDGKQIKSTSIIPWFKSVTFNIIREIRRERDRENVNRKDIPDKEIADLNRPQENVTWKEITNNLLEQDLEITSESALRQRYSRLKTKLKVHNQLVLINC